MLRDPTKRALSAYQHKIWNSDSRETKTMRPFEYDMNHLKGFQTNCILGRRPWREGFSKNRTHSTFEIAQAKRRLRVGFQFVGVLDRLEESVCVFHAMFNARKCLPAEFVSMKHEDEKPYGDRPLDTS